MNQLIRVLGASFCALTLVLAIGCGKEGEGDKKPKLDMQAECSTYFDENKKSGGDKDAFVAACVEDSKGGNSHIACTGPAAGSGFCTKAIEDPATKKSIEAMTAALGN